MKALKPVLFAILVAFTALGAQARGHGGSHSRSYHSNTKSSTSETHVKGYYRKNGTYVAPHYRSKANRSQKDNWSTKGNVNPHTGKEGTKEPKN